MTKNAFFSAIYRPLIDRLRSRTMQRCGFLGAFLVSSNCTGVHSVEVAQSGSGQIRGDEIFEEHVVELPPLIEMNVSTEPATSKVDPSAIEGLFLQELTLSLKDPKAGDSFDFLQSIEVYVKDTKGKLLLVAVGQSFPKGAQEIAIEPTGVEFSELVYKKEIEVTSSVHGRHPAKTLKFDVNITFLADVNVAQASCN